MSKAACYHKMIGNDLKTIKQLEDMKKNLEKNIEKKSAKLKQLEEAKANKVSRPIKPSLEAIIKKDIKQDEKIIENQNEIKSELNTIVEAPKKRGRPKKSEIQI